MLNRSQKHKPELLFQAAKVKDALVGIAHPFSYGDPFARGCRFEMTISDYSVVDFIEVFNNPEPLHIVNEPAVAFWEKLVLEGHRIAATSGMDLHGYDSFADKYATFIEGEANGAIASELETAITNCHTWVSRGPLLLAEYHADENCLQFTVKQSSKPGFVYPDSYQIVLKTCAGETVLPITADGCAKISLNELGDANIIIPKLFGATLEIENLYCISPVIFI